LEWEVDDDALEDFKDVYEHLGATGSIKRFFGGGKVEDRDYKKKK
jgi:hypothetical protein